MTPSLLRPTARRAPRGDAHALFVAISWGEGRLDAAQVEHLGPITLGAKNTDLVVPGILEGQRCLAVRKLGCAEVPIPKGATLVHCGPAGAETAAKAGLQTLGPGETLRYEQDGLRFHFALVEGHAARGRAAAPDWHYARLFAISTLLHAFFGAAALLTPSDEPRGEELFRSSADYRSVLLKRPEPKPAPPPQAGSRGPEGQIGGPQTHRADAAPARTVRRTRQEQMAHNLKVARAAGLLGALATDSAGALGSVFRTGGLGGGLNAAMGGLRGAQFGDTAGLGGLGSRGHDSGGPGTSLQIGGLGRGDRGGLGVETESGPHRETRISYEHPISQGGLTHEEIARVIRRALPRFKFCYEKQLNRRPSLAGKVALGFTIAPNGKVGATTIKESGLADGPVEECLVQVMGSLQFPKPRGGGIVVVSYPFIFATSE